ncbi:alpha/beta fold hydrolase [Novosphingobium piscinae]|uniref:Alpha/beta hydrolase n=1 Tax=Novosphingobium piscinae TaxID=1507448 RepID=A0A7X1KQS7_9SPHN|nr:alpha/beta hydrolase [Novosphingobium piscinae]MBC2669885.1 alpha/beta hydrolase [Novosphingobium piscinae]
MRWRRGLALLGLVLVGAAGFVGTARSGLLKPDTAAMRARYGLPGSRYETIAGQPLHYVDEGQGPAVILVHGSFGSLRMWNDWAAALQGRYRVIRFDRPRMGLSAPPPPGQSGADAEVRLIGALADRLGISRFALVGTSSAGESVARFAARRPERVSAVILANIAAGPIRPAPPHFPAWFKALLIVDPLFGGWHPRAFWRGILDQNYADPRRISPALVQEWTDLNNLPQGSPPGFVRGGPPPFAGTPADLAATRAPALVLWSDRDPEVPLATHGRMTLARLGSATKRLEVVPDCGHMMPLECGPASARRAAAFLDAVLTADRIDPRGPAPADPAQLSSPR